MSFAEGGRSLPKAVIEAVVTTAQQLHGSFLSPKTVAEDEEALRTGLVPLKDDVPPIKEVKERNRRKFLSKIKPSEGSVTRVGRGNDNRGASGQIAPSPRT